MHVRESFAHWKADFFTGLAVVLPAGISIAVVIWLFGTVANFTDTLLFFLPREWTHAQGGEGSVRLYWSVLALVLTIVFIGLVGGAARYYFGKQIIRWVDLALMRVPLLNKLYGAFKQINESLTSTQGCIKLGIGNGDGAGKRFWVRRVHEASGRVRRRIAFQRLNWFSSIQSRPVASRLGRPLAQTCLSALDSRRKMPKIEAALG